MPLLKRLLTALHGGLLGHGTGRLRSSALRLFSYGRVNGFAWQFAEGSSRLRTEIGLLVNAAMDGRRWKHLGGRLLDAVRFLNRSRNVVVLFQMFQEIADVQEGVAIESNIHEGRLHTGEHSCNATFVEASD
jgi:hypothetical protein